jgi:hypothetical protein
MTTADPSKPSGSREDDGFRRGYVLGAAVLVAVAVLTMLGLVVVSTLCETKSPPWEFTSAVVCFTAALILFVAAYVFGTPELAEMIPRIFKRK